MKKYSKRVQSCMRFYVRNPSPIFKDKGEQEYWEACDSVLNEFAPRKRKWLIAVYQENDTFADNVYKIAHINGINQDRLWTLIENLERLVAKRRNWI